MTSKTWSIRSRQNLDGLDSDSDTLVSFRANRVSRADNPERLTNLISCLGLGEACPIRRVV